MIVSRCASCEFVVLTTRFLRRVLVASAAFSVTAPPHRHQIRDLPQRVPQFPQKGQCPTQELHILLAMRLGTKKTKSKFQDEPSSQNVGIFERKELSPAWGFADSKLLFDWKKVASVMQQSFATQGLEATSLDIWIPTTRRPWMGGHVQSDIKSWQRGKQRVYVSGRGVYVNKAIGEI